MNISNLSFLRRSIPIFKEKMLNVLEFSLIAQQQRVALIVSAIFSALAAAFLMVYYFLSNTKNSNVIDKDQLLHDKESVVVKTDSTAKEILDPSSSRDKPIHDDKQRQKAKGAKKSQERPTVLPQSPQKSSTPVIDSKNQKRIDATVRDFESLEGYDPEEDLLEFDEEGSEFDDFDVDEYLSNIDDASGSSEIKVKPKVKCYIGGKEKSYRTFRCLQILEKHLDSLGKVFGTAIDNGDCFWDAFAQRLSIILNKPVTVKELRQQVSDEVHRLDKGPEEKNWVKKLMTSDIMDTYQQYLEQVAITCDEIMSQGLKFYPVWGQEKRDGLILCHLYKVNLRVYGVACADEIDKLEDDECFCLYSEDFPDTLPYKHTVEIALYPGHFIPVHDKADGKEKIELEMETIE
jgi:hypothetical protein